MRFMQTAQKVYAPRIAKCPWCDVQIHSDSAHFMRELLKHKWKDHRDKMIAQSRKGLQHSAEIRHLKATGQHGANTNQPAEGSGGGSFSAGGMAKTLDPVAASVFTATPRSYAVNPVHILKAKRACEQVFGWPTLPVEDWLATYLYWSMCKFGVDIEGYVVIGKQPVIVRDAHTPATAPVPVAPQPVSAADIAAEMETQVKTILRKYGLIPKNGDKEPNGHGSNGDEENSDDNT